MTVEDLKKYNKNECRSSILSSIIFGRLFLLKRPFFTKYFNLFTFSLLFLVLICLVFCPIAEYISTILYNLALFIFYSFILYCIIYFIFKGIEALYPKVSAVDFRDLKNPYIFLSIFIILFNYFYFIAHRIGSEQLLLSYYMYFNFFTFINMITTILIIFIQILKYFIIIVALNYLLNKIIPMIPIFSNRVLFILNLSLFIVVYLAKFSSKYYHNFKMDIIDLCQDSLKTLLVLLITNAIVILSFIIYDISFRLYKFFNRKIIEKHVRCIENDVPIQDNRILYSLVYNSKIVRILLIILLALIIIKFLIIYCF